MLTLSRISNPIIKVSGYAVDILMSKPPNPQPTSANCTVSARPFPWSSESDGNWVNLQKRNVLIMSLSCKNQCHFEYCGQFAQEDCYLLLVKSLASSSGLKSGGLWARCAIFKVLSLTSLPPMGMMGSGIAGH